MARVVTKKEWAKDTKRYYSKANSKKISNFWSKVKKSTASKYRINPKSGARGFTVYARNIQQAVAKGKAKRQKGRLKTGKSFTVRRL